jgi:hypothetical protein
MRKTMLLTLAAASLAAGPALALQPFCTGDACAVVTSFPTTGPEGACWAFRNSSDRTVRGMIVGVEMMVFNIAPGAVVTPQGKSGCYKGGRSHTMNYINVAAPKAAKVKPR